MLLCAGRRRRHTANVGLLKEFVAARNDLAQQGDDAAALTDDDYAEFRRLMELW